MISFNLVSPFHSTLHRPSIGPSCACRFTQASAFLDPSQPVLFLKPFAPFAGHVAQNRRVIPQICLCPKVWRLRGASSPVSSKACGAMHLSMRRPAAAMSLTFGARLFVFALCQAAVGDMGVIAEITEIEFLADGRAHLQVTLCSHTCVGSAVSVAACQFSTPKR